MAQKYDFTCGSYSYVLDQIENIWIITNDMGSKWINREMFDSFRTKSIYNTS